MKSYLLLAWNEHLFDWGDTRSLKEARQNSTESQLCNNIDTVNLEFLLDFKKERNHYTYLLLILALLS